MSSQLQVSGEAKIRDIQGPVVANSGVITALDGAASQYVRGDGTLADFPTSSGGGSSVSYYLNSSVSQGTIGGNAYRELSKDPIIGSGTDITISSNGYVANYITDANDPDVVLVPGGNFNCEFYFSVNNDTGNPTTYAELYKYDGSIFTLLGSSSGVPESINQGTTIAPYYFAIPVATATLATTDRLAIRIYVNVDGRTVTLHTENSHLCQVVTTLSKGMVSLNNLTDQSQYLTTGTSGTNFNIASSGDTHTFNLPVASATNTGKLTNTDWSTFNNKQAALSFTAPLVNTSNTVSIPAASSTVDGYLDNADWTTFNNKQDALTLTTTGTSGAATLVGSTLNIPQYTDAYTGTVTSVAMTVPTGLSVSGSPITTSGTLAVSLASGYSIPTTAKQTEWDTAYTNRITSASFPLSISSNAISISLASASTAGYLSIADWNTFNGKQNALTNPVTGTGNSGYVSIFTGTSTIGNSIIFQSTTRIGIMTSTPSTTLDVNGGGNFSGSIGALSFVKSGGTSSQFLKADGTVDSNAYITATSISAASPLFYNSGTGVISISAATGSTNGYLSSTDWLAFYAKQDAITLTTTGTSGPATLVGSTLNIPQYAAGVGGSGTTNYLPKFTGTSTIGNSLVFDNGTQVIIGGTTVPDAGLKTYVTNGTVGIGNYLSSTVGYIGTWTNHSLGFAINGTNRMTLDTSGNLGLGVTPSAWASNYKSITSQNISLYGRTDDSDRAGIVVNGYYDNSLGFVYTNSAFATLYELQNGQHRWWVAPSGTAGNPISFTQAMTLDSSGRLGIGTASPTYKLDVVGTSGTEIIARFTASGTDIDSQINLAPTGVARGIINATANGLAFAVAGSTKALIASTGNLLVGTTTDAGYKLDVNGTGRINGSLQVGSYLNIYSGAYAAQTIPSIRASSSNNLILNAASTGTLYLNYETGSGGVYFGNGASGQAALITSAGAATFSSSVTTGLYGTTAGAKANSGLIVYNNTAINTYSQIGLGYDGGTYLPSYIGMIVTNYSNYSYGDIVLGTRSVNTDTQPTERMRIFSNGNIAINTTTDAGYKLDVNGTGRFASALTVTNGNIQFGTSENVLKWNSGNGVIEWGSAGTLYLRPTGAASNSLTIASTGAATFSSTIQANNATLGGVISAKGNGTLGAMRITKDSYNRLTIESDDSTNMWNIDNSAGILRFFRDSYNATGVGTGGSVKLSITDAGAATFSSSVTAGGQITMAYGGNPRLTLQDTDAGAGNVGILFKESTNDKWTIASGSGNLQFFNEATASNAMYITSGNNVGIGTSSPTSKLSVFSDGATIPRIGRFVQSNSGTSSIGALQAVNAASTGSAFDAGHWTSSSSNWIIRAYNNVSRGENGDVSGAGSSFVFGVRADGNVGIGTSSPTNFQPFGYGSNIEASGGRGGGFVSSGSTSTVKMVMSVDETGGIYGMLKTLTNHPLMFATNDTERMRITNGGNVLIGTTTDAGYKLDVNGTGRFSNAVNIFGANLAHAANKTVLSQEGSSNGAYWQSYGANTTTVGKFTLRQYSSDGSVSVIPLSIETTGAATFSSSVTINGLLTNYNTFNTQTASYTLVLADASKIVETNVSTANTVTVPTNASVPFPIGTEITIMQYGGGVTTIAAASGVTINSKSNARIIANRYTGATLVKRGTDEWYLIGNIVP